MNAMEGQLCRTKVRLLRESVVSVVAVVLRTKEETEERRWT